MQVKQPLRRLPRLSISIKASRGIANQKPMPLTRLRPADLFEFKNAKAQTYQCCEATSAASSRLNLRFCRSASSRSPLSEVIPAPLANEHITRPPAAAYNVEFMDLTEHPKKSNLLEVGCPPRPLTSSGSSEWRRSGHCSGQLLRFEPALEGRTFKLTRGKGPCGPLQRSRPIAGSWFV